MAIFFTNSELVCMHKRERDRDREGIDRDREGIYREREIEI